MAIKMFAAIDVGSFELEMGIYEISQNSHMVLLSGNSL